MAALIASYGAVAIAGERENPEVGMGEDDAEALG
jgi:hypothetical protein